MINHKSKIVPDRVLKGMCLQAILNAEDEDLHLTSKDIHYYVSRTTFQFTSPETDKYGNPLFSGEYSYNNLPGIRSELSYLRRAGYIHKIGTKKPFTWMLTTEGRYHAEDTFFKYKLKLQYYENKINDEVKHRLSNDEQVVALAEEKRIELCKTCRDAKPPRERLRARTSTANPHQGRIGINRKNGSVKEYTVNEDTGEIKELEDLKNSLVMNKDGSVNDASSFLSLQNENVKMRKVLKQAGITIEKLDTQLIKEKGKKALRDERTFIRNMTRMELSYHYYENNLNIDAEFIEIWKGSLLVVQYKHIVDKEILNTFYDMLTSRSEIMTRTGLVNRILEAEEIPSIGIYIFEIKNSSVVFDSENFKEPKTLKV